MLALVYPVLLVALLIAAPSWCALLIPLNILVIPLVDHLVRWAAPGWKPSTTVLQVLFHPAFFGAYVVAQTATLVYALNVVSTTAYDAIDLWGISSALGIMTGTAGITAAHELMHRRNGVAQVAARALLHMVAYPHFAIVHVRHHHKHVATSSDPGSARISQGFPEYFGCVLKEGMRIALQSERKRLAGRSAFRMVLENRVYRGIAIQVALISSLWVGLGGIAVAVFAMQAFVAVHLLEAVNYVQHYGLTRQSQPSLRPAPVSERHAWDSDYRLSELLVFNLSRHSDHHCSAGKRCHELEIKGESPKLPYSFFLMVFVALIPPIWRAIMDKEVLKLDDHQIRSPRSHVVLAENSP